MPSLRDIEEFQRTALSLPALRLIAAHFSMMLACYELDCEADGKPPDGDAVVSSFMGNGASSFITVDDCAKFLAEIGYWKPDYKLGETAHAAE